MSRIYKSKEFIDLQSKWYKKLKDEGFEDLEEFDPVFGNYNSGSAAIKRPSKYLIDHFNQHALQHFANARNFAEHGKFCSFLDHFIWNLYAEGYSLRDMQPILALKGYKFSIFKIFYTLKRLKLDFITFLYTHKDGDTAND